MKPNRLEISDSQFVISAGKSPAFIRITLSMVLTILVLMPLIVTFAVLAYGDGPHIGIGISFLICWGLGFYLLRVVLWNSFGREIISLKKDKLLYVADFRYFRDGRQELDVAGLKAEIAIEETANADRGHLWLINDTAQVKTVLPASVSDLEKLIAKLELHYPDQFETGQYENY